MEAMRMPGKQSFGFLSFVVQQKGNAVPGDIPALRCTFFHRRYPRRNAPGEIISDFHRIVNPVDESVNHVLVERGASSSLTPISEIIFGSARFIRNLFVQFRNKLFNGRQSISLSQFARIYRIFTSRACQPHCGRASVIGSARHPRGRRVSSLDKPQNRKNRLWCVLHVQGTILSSKNAQDPKVELLEWICSSRTDQHWTIHNPTDQRIWTTLVRLLRNFLSLHVIIIYLQSLPMHLSCSFPSVTHTHGAMNI